MKIPKDAVLLRIFIGESDEFGGRPLHEAIVLKAREMHLAGATVLRGPMGFGQSSLLHTAKILELLPALEQMIGSGLVTLEKVQVLQYGKNKND
jgi:PII-like signaling protein